MVSYSICTQSSEAPRRSIAEKMSSPWTAIIVLWLLSIIALISADDNPSLSRRPKHSGSLCDHLIRPAGYLCSEHTVQTEDGYLLALQRVTSPSEELRLRTGPPVLLQHGLFMAGDIWFLNSKEQSLGFILADQGYDVWIGNVRGTRWSHGHISLSERDKAFWDWSWEQLALVDLKGMISYISSTTDSKIFLVGHSQGTIMSLAALTQPSIAKMVKAAALLSPISYLGHVSAPLVLRMVSMHIDKVILAMGIHQINFRNDIGVHILDSVCEGHLECNNLLTSITGENCCFNNSRVDWYLEYIPHPSSSKNLNHLFQMIRKGAFAKYDYGLWKNLQEYGSPKPPEFDLSSISELLPVWMAYGAKDALADITDVEHTLKELNCKRELLYLEKYGHVDFVLSVNAKQDVYDNMVEFFRSLEGHSSA
ncbi:hypothetical protein V2J09_002093 [Rumex salicifolius]